MAVFGIQHPKSPAAENVADVYQIEIASGPIVAPSFPVTVSYKRMAYDTTKTVRSIQ